MTADLLETDGVAVIKQVLCEELTASLRGHFESLAADVPGARSFDVPQDVRAVVGEQGPMGALAASLAGLPVKPVRILFFDKTPTANWVVPWHQDRTIALKSRHEINGYGPWTTKNGAVHVEPPAAILEGMLTLRLFLDDCGADDGPLEVARGSHRYGRVPAADVKAIAARSEIFVGTGGVTDVLAMKLLAIHSSKRARSPSHRRVLHVDYTSTALPAPLEWAL